VIAGDRDRAYAASAKAMAEGIPGARLVLFEGVGHFPNLESPGRLAEELIGFFAACR
jgi:pimeloyl-ACP methyl ester carboxylesterase